MMRDRREAAGGSAVGTARTKQRALKVASPLAGRRRLHAFSSGTLHFSLRKAFHAATRERACARSPATTLDIFLIENRRVPFPGSASHLAPATSGASPCGEPPFTATEIYFTTPDPRSWLVFFQRAQRRGMYKTIATRSSTF